MLKLINYEIQEKSISGVECELARMRKGFQELQKSFTEFEMDDYAEAYSNLQSQLFEVESMISESIVSAKNGDFEPLGDIFSKMIVLQKSLEDAAMQTKEFIVRQDKNFKKTA